MLAIDATLLIHLVGFMTGMVLYAMLGVTTVHATSMRETWLLA